MTSVTIEFDGSERLTRVFDRKAEFVRNFMPSIATDAMREVKEDIRGEIEGQYYLAGGRRPWARTKDFGDLIGGRPALQSYAGKWQAAPVRVSGKDAEISITAAGASAHVGGRGISRSRSTAIIRARGNPRAMQGAIFRKTGAFVSRRTLTGTGLHLESRPHANPDNPVTARKVEFVMERHFERA